MTPVQVLEGLLPATNTLRNTQNPKISTGHFPESGPRNPSDETRKSGDTPKGGPQSETEKL